MVYAYKLNIWSIFMEFLMITGVTGLDRAIDFT